MPGTLLLLELDSCTLNRLRQAPKNRNVSEKMNKIVISGKQVEEAEVVWFDSRPDKLYGFASVCNGDTNEEIFFHLNNQKNVDIDLDAESVFFVKQIEALFRYPHVGDQILFVRTPGAKGRPKASPWVFLEDWISISSVLDQLVFVCDCGHKMKDHSCGQCTCCDCGSDLNWSPNDPDNFQEIKLSDGRTGVQVVDYHETNLAGDVGGFEIYE